MQGPGLALNWLLMPGPSDPGRPVHCPFPQGGQWEAKGCKSPVRRPRTLSRSGLPLSSWMQFGTAFNISHISSCS